MVNIRKLIYCMVLTALFLAPVLSFSGCSRLSPEDATTTLPKTEQTVVPWPHALSDLEPDPAVVFGRLPNGFRYVLMNNAEPKHRVYMHLNVQAGSLHETDAQRGLAHYLEHMLFNGSTHFEPGELVKYFQSIGMRFGPDANAHTGFNETVYDIRLPDGKPTSIKQGLLVMLDYAQGALLLESEVERERGVILAEKQTRDSASYRTFKETLSFEFPDALVSKRLPIGIEETIRAADRQTLNDFYNTWYRPETMILVMVGDFDLHTAESLVNERFASLQSRAPSRPEPDLGPIDHSGTRPFYHFEQESGDTTVTIETLTKIEAQPDSAAFQKDMLVREMADQVVQNRLDARLSQPGVPFTSATISSGVFLNQIRSSEITADGDPERWQAMLAELEQTLRQAMVHGFTEGELERVKKDYLADLRKAVQTASTRASSRLSRKIIRSLNSNQVFLSPAQEQALFSPFIETLDLSTLETAFRNNWSPGHRLILVTGNAELEKRSQDVLTAFQMSARQPVVPPKSVDMVAFPYLPEPDRIGRIIHRKTTQNLGLTQVEFDNGVRLNVKRTDFKANEVRINVTFGSGKSTEWADSPGLAKFSEEVINESGLGRLTSEDLARATAGTNTTVSFRVKGDSFVFKGKSVPDELTHLFQLLRAHILDPAFREDAFQLVKQRIRQEYAELSRSVEGGMQLTGNRFLAGGDSRFGFPSQAEIDAIRLEDIRRWILPYLENGILEASVVGDVQEERVIQTAARYLGSLPVRRGITTERTDLPTFPKSQSRELVVPTKIPKGLVVVAYPTADMWDIQRTRRLSVLAGVFSERLREEIREKLGAAYSPHAYNAPSRAYHGYGVFKVVIPTDPKRVDEVIREVKRIATSLAMDGVSEDELRRVVDPMVAGIKDMRRDNRYWLNSVLTGVTRHPQQLDWSRSIVADYASITTGEVFELARKFLENGAAATLIIRPVSDLESADPNSA